MLPLMLMLVADPLTPPAAEPAAPSVRIIDAEGVMRAVIQTVDAAQRQCRNVQLHQVDNGTVIVDRTTRARPSTPITRSATPRVQNDLMFRQGDPVEMTLLLERRIGGCSVPISYDVAPGGRLPSFPARAD